MREIRIQGWLYDYDRPKIGSDAIQSRPCLHGSLLLLAHMFIARRWRRAWCIKLRCSSRFCLGFGVFSSFLHLFCSASFIFPTSLQIPPLIPESPTYWYRSLRSEGFGHGCDMRSTTLILFPHSCWWNSKELRICNQHLPAHPQSSFSHLED